MQQQQGNAAPAAAGAANGDTPGPASAANAARAATAGGPAPVTAATPGQAGQRTAQTSAPQQRTAAATANGSTQARPQQQAPPAAAPAPPAAPPAQNQNGGSGYRPLNVKDALSYLDSVKIQFNDRPQIYNNFLDIMKDFKTQNIDTPGVIDRVSSLFRGHPPLIQGFNTFLPPGYKIDCAFDAAGRDIITITTPSGVTKRDGGGGALQTGPRAQPNHQQAGQAAAAAAPGANTATGLAGKPGQPEQVARPSVGSHAPAPGQAASQAAGGFGMPQTHPSSVAANQAATISKGPSPFSGGIAGIGGSRPGAPQAQSGPAGPVAVGNPATSARPGQIPSAAQPGNNQTQILGYNRAAANAAAANRPPAEFNHAINFVNKIKTRFAGRPNTYKAFLEILQTYQKEQKSIQEVYAQVTVLFQEAPELLEEFKDFLPDHTGSTGLSGAQSSAIEQASASNAAAAAQSATQSRTGRNTSTTSLFGVNASSTSQPQVGGVPSYLHNAQQRDRSKVGQVIGGTSLDVAASRRQVGPEHPSTSQLPAPALVQDKATHDDDEWQAPGSARKRKPTAPAVPVVEKMKQTKRSKYAPEDSPEEAGMPPYVANRSYVQVYPTMVPNGAPAPVQPIILPHALRPHGPKTQLQPMISSEELGLFDRIKRYVDDKATYQEFLKLLNLYTAEIIDMPTLLEKAFLFIGGNDEIFGLFREFVGEQDGFVDGEEWPIDNAPALERERFELHNLKSYGPSYRKLPYQESKGLACSGRDALCWSVLNDNWVAYATWASEGSGAHRKNAFEDALACSEQERHWYDYHLESIRRSIAVLEPIVARINLMSVEEKAAFKLKPGLGGDSSSFYERIIRKVYGKDQGYEAISALYDSPGTAAPIILSRMKQKDEEWHRALREWNRVWREVDAKNFYRSIDHQGLTFKTNDKKTTTSKYLASEIENLRREQQQKRVFPAHKANNLEPLRPRHQYEMHIGDVDVVFDVLKLIFSYLDRATTAYAAKERLAIENTLRRFVPLFFNIPEADVEATLAPAITFGEDGDNAETDAAESDADDTAGASDTGATSEASGQSTPATGKKGKKSVADLRKQLLTSAINGASGLNGTAQEDATSDSTDAKGESETDKVHLDESSWISASSVPWPAGASTPPRAPPHSPSKMKSHAMPSPRAGPVPESVKTALQDSKIPRYNCFVSQPFYCFIRLFHLLYHRLATLKSLAAEIAAKEPAEDRLNPLAVELGLAVPIPNIDEPSVRRGKNFYEFALELCERYFDAEIDSATFEENLRYMWGIKAFPAFTVDKLVASMIKNAHTINNDSRCHELIDLLAKDREEERTSLRHQIAYRHTAESVIGTDENIYRLEWIPSQDVLTIQLLSPDDLTIDDPVLTADKTWAHYLETYTLGLPTEGLPSDVRGPLLDRNREANVEAAARLQGKSDLAVRLGYDNFKLSYVSQTEETFFKATAPDETDVEEANKARREAWEKWLADNNGTVDEAQSKRPDAAESAQALEPSAMAVDV